MSTLTQKSIALFVIVIASLIGYVSYLSFMVFLYNGALDWIKLDLGESGKLILNGALCLIFFLQHSGMIWRSFRRRISNFIPEQYQGAVYTLASGATLLAFVTFWQASDTIMFEAVGPFKLLLRALFFLSILGLFWGLCALRTIDMFGLKPILDRIVSTPTRESAFTVRGPYRWVRHPLYLFMIVLFWCCPVLTTDRLLFNTLWTIWVVLATALEERDLTNDFGVAYREYQQRIPMFLPRGFRPPYTE